MRAPGNGNGWNIQYIMPEALAQTGPWHCYAVAKAVAKPGVEAKGTAFLIGLLNPKAKKNTTLATASLEETADGSFRAYDLGVHDLTGGMNFYVAGVSRPEVQSILVDRFFFVRK